MKGVVFTEFLDLVDDSFGEAITDEILSQCPLASGGAYTAVDTYDGDELDLLVNALSKRVSLTPAQLHRVYGRKLFGSFGERHPDIAARYASAFDMLENVEGEIHREVRKLYTDASLPQIATERLDEKTLVLRYTSDADMPHFCRGLIEGCLVHYGSLGVVHQEEAEPCDGRRVHVFTITLD